MARKDWDDVSKDAVLQLSEAVQNISEVAMSNHSLVTKMVVRAFHAFVQQRLKAELSDPEVILMCHSTNAADENQRGPKHRARPRMSPATSIR